RVLRQVHCDTGISNKAMVIPNSFVNNIFERIGTPSLYFFIAGLTLVTVLRQVHPDEGISNGGHGHPELVCQRYLQAHRCTLVRARF
ncbi:uncharacterized protein HD556DRAFT_1237662, partial [Suillus plorans]